MLDLDAAKTLIAHTPPDVILLDWDSAGKPQNGLAFLEALKIHNPPIPVVVMASRADLSTRLQVAQKGSIAFLQTPIDPSQAIGSIVQSLQQVQKPRCKILAVDDDTQLLSLLQGWIDAEGLQLIGLTDPRCFWDLLEETLPDLVILDVEMPHINGIDLCRVIRSDPRWQYLPIIFMTAHQEETTIDQVFQAGADDYLSKPVGAPILLNRIFSRLERFQHQQRQADLDTITGINNRHRASQELEKLLGLARRYNHPLCLALLNLDHFKQINDQHGYACGNKVLQQISQLLRQTFRREDVIGRWGGDELIVGLYGSHKRDAVERLAETLESLRQQRFVSPSGKPFYVTFTAGIAQYPEDGIDVATLYRAADNLIYQAKEWGQDRVLPVGWQPPQHHQSFGLDVVLVGGEKNFAQEMMKALETRSYHARWLPDYAVALNDLCEAGCRAKIIVLESMSLEKMAAASQRELDQVNVLKRLKRKQILSQSRLILLTADSAIAEQALHLGAFDYILTPCSVSVLLPRLMGWVNSGISEPLSLSPAVASLI